MSEVDGSEPVGKNLAEMAGLFRAAGGAITAADAIEDLFSR
jgi:hypothetical protein